MKNIQAGGGHGGSRPGAGRKAGSPNKATAARQAEVAATGITPLDYLLSVMRNEEAEESKRIDAAKAAAPYVHPRLATTEIKNPDGETFKHEFSWLG